MMKTIFRKTMGIAALLLVIISTSAQDSDPGKEMPAKEKKEVKAYKILTAGKRITIQSNSSNNNLKRVLVWTSTGHRIVEQHNLDVSSYVFNISVKEKIFFLMLEMKSGKRYTEKFGIE
jgi:hypothetical protein